MPIELYTGQPGNGKTVQLMKRLLKDAQAGTRPVYAAGIDGLEVAGVEILDDPKRWNETDLLGNYLVPNGSIIYVDEAWKWFGHLQDASRALTPAHVLALAEHRHRGLDFVWTTQMPNQLFPFVRGLVGSHTHVVRRFGTQFIDLYAWGELQEDVKSQSKREMAQRTTDSLDKSTFQHYKSAELHTIKRKLPWKIYAVPVLLVAGVLSAFFAYRLLRPDHLAESLGGKPVQAAQAADGSSSATPAARYATAAQYATAFTPRIQSMPWTAPGYDGRAVVSQPRVYCVKAGSGRDADGKWVPAHSTCLTEQGTPYEMDTAAAENNARHGEAYNPFRAPPRENSRDQGRKDEERGAGAAPAAMAGTAAPAATSHGGGEAFGSTAAYGNDELALHHANGS
jgi:hypothetical protein